MSALDGVLARLVSLCIALAVLAVGLATAFGFLVAGSYLLLREDLPSWAAALIVGAVLLLLAPLTALVLARAGRRAPPPPPVTTRPPADAERALLDLDRAIRRSPWTLVAGGVAAGIVLGMSGEARRAAADLLANLFRPPR